MKRELAVDELSPDTQKVLRAIVGSIIEQYGLTGEEDIDGAIELIERGYLRLRTDGQSYWLEQCFPTSVH